MSIIHAFTRLVLGLFAPGTGRRRAGARPAAPAGAAGPSRPGPGARRLPAPRSPYGLGGPIDGEATALVRPYLAAHEARHRKAWQHVALALAADLGADPAEWEPHGLAVAR